MVRQLWRSPSSMEKSNTSAGIADVTVVTMSTDVS